MTKVVIGGQPRIALVAYDNPIVQRLASLEQQKRNKTQVSAHPNL